jgi:hypothetical protein
MEPARMATARAAGERGNKRDIKIRIRNNNENSYYYLNAVFLKSRELFFMYL